MVNLSWGFAERGLEVDLVLAKAEGPYITQVPAGVRVVDLRAPRVLASLPALVRYLRRERPAAILSALDHANIVAIWARRLARVRCRAVVSVHSTLSRATDNTPTARGRLMPRLVRQFYPWADAVVAVSRGVAEDLVRTTGILQESIKVIYNPVVTPELLEKAREPLDHPWFAPGQPPVILSVGRLTAAKDYPTLIRAFALVRAERPARLVILGEGEERPRLESLVRELHLEAYVALPGFVENPYAYMTCASVFVLSSAWEGLPTVLIEALALGTSVVSTDCPSGPQEILEGGRWGKLVTPGNPEELARAILATLEESNGAFGRIEPFTLEHATTQYLALLEG
ncbi:MAG: glycosyltransferase [Clostridia bacterium]|nr:MAG: glycosyltransferase [Clostridia bacterium]